jgi:murein L,D-transpeptidase YcbB/YkuD
VDDCVFNEVRVYERRNKSFEQGVKEMKRFISWFATCWLITIVALIFSFWAVSEFYEPKFDYTIEQVQKIIGTEADGKLGPKTQKAWERYIND